MSWEFKKSYIHPSDVIWLRLYDQGLKLDYDDRYLVSKRLQPKKILEIGVRRGYSALSYLNGSPEALYVGIDPDCTARGCVGDTKEFFPDVRKLLQGYNIELRKQFSTQLESIVGAPFDFIHIDGAHDYEAVKHDLELSYSSLSENGVIIIDGFDGTNSMGMPPVVRATKEFFNKYNLKTEVRKTYGGQILMFNGDQRDE